MIAMIIHILLVYLKLPTVIYIVDSLYSKINQLILDSHETHQPHITDCDMRSAMQGLKSHI